MKSIKIKSYLETKDIFEYETYLSDFKYININICIRTRENTVDSCRFEQCHFQDCTFTNMECLDVIFDHCTFENVHFVNCSLSRVHFLTCRISGMEVSNSLLHDVWFYLCKGPYCDFGGSHFKDCVLDTCDFSESGFIQCEMKKTTLKKCVFTNSEWYNTSLKGLDFTSCDVYHIGVSSHLIGGVIVNERQALEFVKLLGIVIQSE